MTRAGSLTMMGWAAHVLLAVAVAAQEPGEARGQAGSLARFEVATVKANRSGESGGSLRPQPGGRVDAINMPLRMLVSFAYQVQPFLLADAPDWIATERFDILAKLDGDAGTGANSIEVLRGAMRGLLTDRFKLKVHRERRDTDIYALMTARTDGRLGPRLARSSQTCDQARPGAPAPATVPANTLFCGMQAAAGGIRSNGLPLSMLATVLAPLVGRSVIDRTGLSGGWDLELSFAPTSPAGDLPAPATTDAPSIYTALQEQLGLKLQPARGSEDVLVVEHVERPTSD